MENPKNCWVLEMGAIGWDGTEWGERKRRRKNTGDGIVSQYW